MTAHTIMVSFLVALAYYLTLLPTGASALASYLPQQASLPSAGDAAPSATVVDHSPRKKDPDAVGIETTARAALAMDWATGETLFAKNAYEPLPIASITKLVTALVVLETAPDWEKVVLVSGDDMRPGNIPYVIPGERIKVRDLFNVSLVASGNGATVALARSTGLSEEEFAMRMNRVAKEIGMHQATFVEPTGLDARNAASAADVAVLVRRALEADAIREAVQQERYSFTAETGLAHTVASTDQLLRSFLAKPPYRFLGGKTGSLGEAGYCFGASAANADGDRVVAVVLGAATPQDRFDEVKGLLYWVFESYEWPRSALSRAGGLW